MKDVSVREARKIIGQLDSIIKKEGNIQITRRGKPIARVMSVKSDHTMPSHKTLRADMPKVRIESADLIRTDREER